MVNDLSLPHQWSVDEEALKQQATNTQGYDATSLNNRVIDYRSVSTQCDKILRVLQASNSASLEMHRLVTAVKQ